MSSCPGIARTSCSTKERGYCFKPSSSSLLFPVILVLDFGESLQIIYSSLCLCIYSPNLSTHVDMNPSILSPIYPPLYLSTLSIHSSPHQSSHPCVHPHISPIHSTCLCITQNPTCAIGKATPFKGGRAEPSTAAPGSLLYIFPGTLTPS